MHRSNQSWLAATVQTSHLRLARGCPYAPLLTPGNVSDVKAAPALLNRAGRKRYLLGDKRYDADQLRRLVRDVGAVSVIPGWRNRKCAIRYDKQRYVGRHLIKHAFCRLKDVCRLATRYDKLSANLCRSAPKTGPRFGR
ncbi:MAG: transposase [Oxalobacteraceae bacterium]|nr:MAG: transposase [Oxalobacteraceae bacterium]